MTSLCEASSVGRMLKIFFNRHSLVVRVLEVAGVINSILILKNRLPRVDFATDLYLFLLLSYLFMRVCDWIHWYPGEPRGVGIEAHFKGAMVPTSYILFTTSIFALLQIPFLSTALILFADLLMLVITPVNLILIYFHWRDKDPLPINYFSLNKYLLNNSWEDTALPLKPSSVSQRFDRSLRSTRRNESDPVDARSL